MVEDLVGGVSNPTLYVLVAVLIMFSSGIGHFLLRVLFDWLKNRRNGNNKTQTFLPHCADHDNFTKEIQSIKSTMAQTAVHMVYIKDGMAEIKQSIQEIRVELSGDI